MPSTWEDFSLPTRGEGRESLEGADVLCDPVRNTDRKAALAWDPEAAATFVGRPSFASVEFHIATACDDVHAFGGVRAEVVVTGVDEPQGFLAAVAEAHGVAHDFTIEIDVGFGHRSDAVELGRK